MGIIGIGNEIEAGREEKMTVEEAINYLSQYYPTTTATLANEIKRLREDVKAKEAKFQIARAVKINLWGGIYDILEDFKHS